MTFLYITIRNALLFYFLVTVINGIKISENSNVASTIIAGIILGALIASIPSILKFFKIPSTTAASFLLSLILVFAFFFLLYSSFLGLGAIGASDINLGLGTPSIKFNAVQTMVMATVVMSLGSVGLDALGRRR